MATQVFVNLPTSDLERSTSFYTALGFTINPDFTNDDAACVVVDENIYFMMLVRDFFASFTDKQVADPKTHVLAMTALSCESRGDVDTIAENGLAAGGAEAREAQDLGFMYSRALEDPDGNIIEFVYMEPSAAAGGPDAYTGEGAG